MKILFFLLLLLGHISFGQTTIRGITSIKADVFTSDSVNKSPNTAFNDRIKLLQIDQSTANVDIRLYRLHSLSNTKTLRRLFLFDTIWNAVEYVEWNKPVKIKKYKLKAKSNFDSLFSQLLSYNILTLPNQTDLKNKMRKVVGVDEEGYEIIKVLRFTDGESYTLEIKIGSNFRVYHFSNPDSYSKAYENVSELKDYLSIVQSFDKLLDRK